MDDRRFRILILGAGFSRLAGFPLGPALWQMIISQLRTNLGGDTHLDRDLALFREYKQLCFGQALSVAEIDYEEFLSFLDTEHYLGLRGSDTWSLDGNESQLLIKGYIGKVLLERIESLKAMPEPYLRFAASLRPGDTVLTYNYDTLLERALDLAGVRYRLFPHRYREIGVTSNTIDDSRGDEIVVLKLHGSVDWFDRSSYAESLEVAAGTAARSGLSYTPRHPLFGPDAIATPVPLVDGPRSAGDPLLSIYRVRDPAPLFRGARPIATPFILAPSYSKILYSSKLQEFWYGMNRAGGMNLGMAILGYSVPRHDHHALQAVFALTRNYTESWWEERMLGKRKLPLRIVDFEVPEATVSPVRERYRFLNWNRTELFLKGFDDEAVDFVFREPGVSDRRPVSDGATGND